MQICCRRTVLSFYRLVAVLLSIYLFTTIVSGFTVTVLHTNDVHARFDPSSASGATCRGDPSHCYGGVARRMTKVAEMRDRYENVLLLDAGDQYQGTLWFWVHDGQATMHFMNELRYDAMALGNHEFDNSVDGIVPFMRDASFPILSCNIDAAEVPEMVGLFDKSVVLELDGQRVGIVGYTTKETRVLALDTGRLRFLDEVTSIQQEVDRLVSEGVNKIIALGHAGIRADRKIAENVRGVDLIVGGHSHTFLYSGEEPAEEKAEDTYPVVVTQQSTGDRVLITQAYSFGKYLGFLRVTFDEEGKVTHWEGNPILLDHSVEEDAEIVDELNAWRAPIDAMYGEVIGYTRRLLDGAFTSCRLRECTFGDAMGDAMLDYYRRNSSHRDVSVAILNGGAIRSSIDPGNVTHADVIEGLPFGVTVDVIEIAGTDLLRVLEHSVADYDPCNRRGKFLQISGLRVTYDLSKPNGQRVHDVIVRNQTTEEYVDLDSNFVYKVAVSSFLTGGGDGYSMIRETMKRRHNFGVADADIFRDYVKRHSPLNVTTDGRITFLPMTTSESCNSVATGSRDLLAMTSLLVCTLIAMLRM